jgi:hypothetical protein
MGTTKKDKLETVLAINNELQLQDSTGSDEEVDISTSSKTAMVCKLAQVPPEIWMTLSTEAKKWLLHERKRQQKDSKKDTDKAPEKDRTNSSHMPSQYAKVKILRKGRKNFKVTKNRIIGSLMNSLKKRSIFSICMNHIRKQTMIIELQSITYIQVSV